MARSVVITGGAKGIGKALVRAFAAAGDRIALLDIERPVETNDILTYIECDLTDESAVRKAVGALSLTFPKVDVFINNAGSFRSEPFSELTTESWQQTLDCNLNSVFIVTRELTSIMATGGVIINISSSLGRIPEPEAMAYSVAKAGVNMLTRCLALALAPAGVRVLGIAPGPIASGADSTDEICQISGEDLAALNPLSRFGTVDEVASLAIFLASKEASYMTGSVISQNGGEDAFEGSWSGMRSLRDSGALTKAGDLTRLQFISPSERVRLTADRVLEEASHVHINMAALQRFVSSLDVSAIRSSYCWEADFHPSGTREQLVNYVFSIDAVNFGSGFSQEWKERRPYSTYQTVASALTELQGQGGVLDADFARCIRLEQVAEIFRETADFPLIPMFARAWNSLGTFVSDGYGSYSALLDSLPAGNAAQTLIDLLVKNVPEFNDHCIYKGGVAFFYKRAQILVNDLHLALGADSPFGQPEIAELTMFADNLVAHVFETEKVLEYSESLKKRILQQSEISVGSEEEAEIRAAEIVCVEKATSILQQAGNPDLSSAMVDVYLWNLGQVKKYKSLPRHISKTYFY